MSSLLLWKELSVQHLEENTKDCMKNICNSAIDVSSACSKKNAIVCVMFVEKIKISIFMY